MEYPQKSFFDQIKCFINMVRHLDVHTLIPLYISLLRYKLKIDSV